MRRSGSNSVGDASASALALCDGHGGLLAYNEPTAGGGFTFNISCNDGRKCSGGATPTPTLCDDSKDTPVKTADQIIADGLHAACDATPGKIWASDAQGCVDGTPGKLPGNSAADSAKAAAATTLAMSAAATKAYSADPSNASKANALKLASAAYQTALAWEKVPTDTTLSAAWTTAYTAAVLAVAASNKPSGQTLPTKAGCDANGGTWDAKTATCTSKSSNTMLYVGGAGLAALLLWLATRKKSGAR